MSAVFDQDDELELDVVFDFRPPVDPRTHGQVVIIDQTGDLPTGERRR